MNDLRNFIDKYDLNVYSYKKLKNIKIVDTSKGKYVLKDKFSNDDNLYEYLNNKNFSYILNRDKLNDYTVYPYINQVEIPDEEKAIELIYILSVLHNKTTFYRETSLDKTKEIYEELSKRLIYLNYYYHDLQDVIEQKIFMSPCEYLLIRNISLVYSSLNFSKEKLEEWYKLKSRQKKERVVLLHNKPCLAHILVGEDKQLISWDNYKRDIPIYDFVYFYKKDFMDLEMSTLFDMYQSKFFFSEDEYLLFIVLITIPEKLVFDKSNYDNCLSTFIFVRYLIKTRDFVLKENEKSKKEDKDEFEK